MGAVCAGSASQAPEKELRSISRLPVSEPVPGPGFSRVPDRESTAGSLLSPEDSKSKEERVKLAGSKLIGGIKLLNQASLSIEDGSVYGAVILMPQLGRSLQWPSEITQMVVNSWMYHIACCLVHAALLMYIDKEEHVLDAFSGQMYLCDFGAHLDDCPESGCIGPGGTEMTPPRLYSWDAYIMRTFIRDSLKAVLPDTENLGTIVDPAMLCMRMFQLLIFVPNKNESWVDMKEGKEQSGRRSEFLEMVDIKIAGMPIHWKIVNGIFVLLPKVSLLYLTAVAGMNFLMETAGIDDIIVNSVALGFLLSLDELITQTLLSEQAKTLMEKCEGIPLSDTGEENEVLTDDEILDRYYNKEHLGTCEGWMSLFFGLFVRKAQRMYLLAGMAFFLIYGYYSEHCNYVEGRWISKTMYAPKTMAFGFVNAFFSNLFPLDTDEEPYWTYSG